MKKKNNPQCEFWLRNGIGKTFSGKNIFCSIIKQIMREERIIEIVHCPFEGRAKLHHLCQPNGQVGWCQLASNSKGQCTFSKILFPLHLYTFIEQNIFFQKHVLPAPFLSKNSRCESTTRFLKIHDCETWHLVIPIRTIAVIISAIIRIQFSQQLCLTQQ